MKKIMSIMLVAFLMCLLSVSCRNVYIMDMLPEVDDEDPGLADAAPRPVMISRDESLSRMIESRGAYDVEGHTSKMYLFFCPAIAGFSSEVYEEEEYEDELYDFGISFTRTKWNEKKYRFTGRGEKVYFDVDYDDDLRSYSFLQIVKMDGVDIDPNITAQDYYVVSKSDGPIIYDEASSSWQGTTSTYVWMDRNDGQGYGLLTVSSGDYYADGITAGVLVIDPITIGTGIIAGVKNPQINFGQANELTEKADEAIKDMSNDGKVVQLIYKNYSDGKYKVCGTDGEGDKAGGPVDIKEINQWGSELKNDNMKWLRILAEKHDLESGD